MTFGKRTVRKGVSMSFLLITWTAAIFWVGWQAPSLFGDYFAPEVAEAPQAKFYPLEPFVISVPGKDLSHYLLIEMALKSPSADVEESLKQADPLIRNALMKMFSQKPYEQLNNAQQLDTLQQEAHNLFASIFLANHFDIQLDDVLFTRMIIQ